MQKTRELLLRAVLHYRAAHVVAHTVELSPSLVFVETHCSARIGERISLELSFPGLIAPFTVDTQVIARKIQIAPGESTGLVLGFLFYSEAERQVLQYLLAVAGAPSGEPASPHYRVLVVEDNQFIRDAFAFGVRKLSRGAGNFTVEMVGDSRDALQRLFDQPYDLAIVDYFLPTDNGDRLISRLRSNPGLDRLPICAFSSGGADIRRAALDAGADMFLQKPAILRRLFPTLACLSAAPRQPL